MNPWYKVVKNFLMLFRFRVSNSQYTPNASGYGSLHVTVNNKSLPGDTINSVPQIMPYGVFSLAPDNSNGVGSYLGGGIRFPVMLGILPAFAQADIRFSGLSQGDSCLYSDNFALQATSTGLKYILLNTPAVLATPVIGEWMRKILMDTITALQAAGITSEDLEKDYEALLTEQIYVTSTGVLP